MTPARLRRELADLTEQRGQLETQRAQTAAALEGALTSEHYDGGIVAGFRAQLAHAVTRLRDLDERHALLAAQLPTRKQVQQAEREIGTLRQACADTSAAFDAAALAYGEALEVAERAARQLAQCRAVGREAVAALITVADDAGLTVTVPPVPTLPPGLELLRHLQAHLVGEAAIGEPDDVTLRDLAAARSDRAAQQLGATAF